MYSACRTQTIDSKHFKICLNDILLSLHPKKVNKTNKNKYKVYQSKWTLSEWKKKDKLNKNKMIKKSGKSTITITISSAVCLLTGIVYCCHWCTFISHHTHSNNRNIVGASRWEVSQQEPVVFCHKGVVSGGDTKVVLIVVHVLWEGPGEVDGINSLRLHCDGARRVGNWRRRRIWLFDWLIRLIQTIHVFLK